MRNNSVTYPILRRMLRYSVDQQLQHYCHLMTLGVQVLARVYLIVLRGVCLCYTMVYQLAGLYTNDT